MSQEAVSKGMAFFVFDTGLTTHDTRFKKIY